MTGPDKPAHASFCYVEAALSATNSYFRDPCERKPLGEINSSVQNEFKWQSNAGEADREHFTLPSFHTLP